MSSAPLRFSQMRHLGATISVLGALGGVLLIIWGFMGWNEPGAIWRIVCGGTLSGGAGMVFVLTRLSLKIEANTSRLHGLVHELHARMDRQERSLAEIQRNTGMSDAVRSMAHRSLEWEALRQAASDYIRRENFEAVFRLIHDLEQQPGYKAEADRLRSETRVECADAFRKKLLVAIEHVTKLLGSYQWDQAQHEIERLEKLMPNELRVKELWSLHARSRDEYKHALMKQWNEAVNTSNIERGIELLKELDQYLTPAEAHSAESQARELFRERLSQLGIQFQFAVKDRRWRDALSTGLQIIEEFPNARMAGEIRERLDALRERAGIPVDVEVTARDDASR